MEFFLQIKPIVSITAKNTTINLLADGSEKSVEDLLGLKVYADTDTEHKTPLAATYTYALDGVDAENNVYTDAKLRQT